jgi:hypothetical protein
MRNSCLRQSLVFLLVGVSVVYGEWSNVNFHFTPGESSKITGPGKSYSSVRPSRGEWTFTCDLRNHMANLTNEPIRVYSASIVGFHDYNIASGHAGMTSHLAFKINLSEPVRGVKWRSMSPQGMVMSKGATMTARYSTDGKVWIDAYKYPFPSKGTNEPLITLSFPKPIRELYLGWFADVPKNENGFWNLAALGPLTFSPVRKLSSTPPVSVEPLTVNLQGPRFIPNDFFGTTTHVNSERCITYLKDLNMRAVRIDFVYQVLEPAPGQYNFTKNFVIDSADLGIKDGLDQLAVVTSAPGWASEKGGAFPTAQSVKNFEECMFRIATKYKGKITYWEAWNEPNMAIWKERYVMLLKAFYKGIKRADPNNKVVMAAFAGQEEMEMDAAYRYGAKDYFDILNSHSYTRPALPDEGGYLGKIEALYRVMKKYGDTKPLWVTEMGWNGLEPSMLEYMRAKYPGHRSYSSTEETQARGLARLYLLSATCPWIKRVYFFHLPQEAGYTQENETCDYYMGLVSPWLNGDRPKDAYFAVKTVIQMIDESTYREKIDLGSRLYALVFTRPKDALIALWSLEDSVTLTIKDSSMINKVTSMVGTPILIKDNVLALSGRPIYLSTDLSKLPLLKEQIRAAKIKGIKDYALSLALDLKKSKPNEPVLDVELTNTANVDKFPPAIRVKAAEPWMARPETLEGKALLKAGEIKNFAAALTGPAKKTGEISINVSAWLSNTPDPVRVEKTLRFTVIPRKPDNFKADGDLSEWAGFTPITIGRVPSQREIAEWKGLDDCSGQWYSAWDKDALYFAAEVKDNIHCQPAGSANATDMWQGDSLQIGLDLAGDARASSNVPSYDGKNDVEIGFALGKTGPLAFTWINPNGKTGNVDLKDFSIVRDEAKHLTRYEIAIPWSVFGYTESPEGKWMGMNLVINDNDGQGRRGCLQWEPGMCYTKDPSQFAKVLFGN